MNTESDRPQNPGFLEAYASAILTGVVACMQKSEPSPRVRQVATVALLNAIEFCRDNFGRENERNIIMQVICEATQSEDPKTAVPALQTLVKIVSLYYEHMERYMGAALFGVSAAAPNRLALSFARHRLPSRPCARRATTLPCRASSSGPPFATRRMSWSWSWPMFVILSSVFARDDALHRALLSSPPPSSVASMPRAPCSTWCRCSASS